MCTTSHLEFYIIMRVLRHFGMMNVKTIGIFHVYYVTAGMFYRIIFIKCGVSHAYNVIFGIRHFEKVTYN